MSFWDDPSGSLLKQQHRWVVSLGNSDFDPAKEADTNKNTIPFYYAKSVDQPSYTIKTVQAKYLYSHTFNFPTRPVWNSISITFYDVLMNQKDASLVIDPTVSLYQDFLIKGKGKPTKFRDQIVVDGKVAARNVSDTIKLKQSTQLFFYALLQSAGYITPHETDNENNLMRFKSFNFKKNMIKALVGDSPDYISNTAIQGNEIKLDGNVSKSSDWKYLSIWHLDAEGNQTHGWKLYNPMVTDVKMDRLDYSSENAVTITAKIEYDWAAVLENAPIGITFGSQKIPLEGEFAIGSATRELQKFTVGDILAGAEGLSEADKLAQINERRKQSRDELLRIYEAANPQAIGEQIDFEKEKIEYLLPDFNQIPIDERTLIGAAAGQFPELENVKVKPEALATIAGLTQEQTEDAVKVETNTISEKAQSLSTASPQISQPLPAGVTPELRKFAQEQSPVISPETISGKEYTVQEKIDIAKEEISVRTPDKPLSDIARAYALGEYEAFNAQPMTQAIEPTAAPVEPPKSVTSAVTTLTEQQLLADKRAKDDQAFKQITDLINKGVDPEQAANQVIGTTPSAVLPLEAPAPSTPQEAIQSLQTTSILPPQSLTPDLGNPNAASAIDSAYRQGAAAIDNAIKSEAAAYDKGTTSTLTAANAAAEQAGAEKARQVEAEGPKASREELQNRLNLFTEQKQNLLQQYYSPQTPSATKDALRLQISDFSGKIFALKQILT